MNQFYRSKTLLILLLCFTCFPREGFSQSFNEELEKRSGFKSIRLAASIDSVKGATQKKEFKEKGNTRSSYIYEIKDPEYASIGDIAVKEIEAKVYNGLVYELTIITEKDPKLMKAMERALGQASYDQKNEKYYWRAESLILSFISHSKKELRLVYNSLTVPEMMKKDNSQHIDDISSDF